jgi:hypothetical protein
VNWAGWLAAGLSFLEAAYMIIDGSRALATGSYITPKRGQYAGQLGPWAGLVRRLGIDPNGRGMKRAFLVYGTVWIAIAVGFLSGFSWGWAAMLAAAVGSLWYLTAGTMISAAVMVLLFLSEVRGG